MADSPDLSRNLLFVLSRVHDHTTQYEWMTFAEVINSLAHVQFVGSAVPGHSVADIESVLERFYGNGLITKMADKPIRATAVQLTDEGLHEFYRTRAPADATVDSSRWTGISSGPRLDSERLSALVALLKGVERDLDRANLGNTERAQALAYFSAIRALAEAPEPPVDLIWQLVERASQIAGVAALFVSIIALFK